MGKYVCDACMRNKEEADEQGKEHRRIYAGAAKKQWQDEVWKRDQLQTPLFI